MKVTYNWLKDFVEIKITPHSLAERLTMAGFEVTSLEEKEGDLKFERITSRSKNLDKCQKALQESKEAFEKNDAAKAKELYIEARNLYINLEYREKKEIYSELMELYDKLLK